MRRIETYEEETMERRKQFLSSHRQFSQWWERIIVACVVIPLFCYAPNEM